MEGYHGRKGASRKLCDDYPLRVSPKLNGEGIGLNGHTSLTQQLEWPCLVNRKAGRGS